MSTSGFAATMCSSEIRSKIGKLSCYFLLPVEAILFSPQLAVIPTQTQEAAPFCSCSSISSPCSAEPTSVTAVMIILAQHTSFP